MNTSTRKQRRIRSRRIITCKSDVRVFMFKGRFGSKEEFWEHIVKTREKRADIKKQLEAVKRAADTNLGCRYANKVPKENIDILENIIFTAVGRPAHYNAYYVAGSPEKTTYNGWFDGGQYSTRCQYNIHVHNFTIHVPRELQIDVKHFDYLYNVFCALAKETHGIKIYKASWIVKERGFNFKIEKGYVATKFGECYHASTVKEAIKGLNKKLKRIAYKFELKPDTVINLSTFRKITGACIPGCQDFLARHNLPQNLKMTVQEGIELLRNKGQDKYASLLEKAIKC